MPRRIVLIRSHEPLQEGWRKRSFGPSGPLLDDRVKVAGVRFDETYHPVQVWRRIGGGDDPPAASGFNYGALGPAATYAVRVDADDEDAVERLRRDRRAEVVGVFADPAVSPFPSPYCGASPIGATQDVARRLGVPALHRAKLTGRGVHVAVVDTGIDGSRIPVAGGWAPTPGYVPGSSAPNHGTMVAYDVRIAAPDAQIFDYALLTSQAGTWAAFLSDAIAAFADLVEQVNAAPGRWVVNNSWGLFDRASDAPIGSPENYSANPDHPFNQVTGHLVCEPGRRGRGSRAPPGVRHRPTGTGAAQRPVAADGAGLERRRLGLRPRLRGDRCGSSGAGAGVEAAGAEASKDNRVAPHPSGSGLLEGVGEEAHAGNLLGSGARVGRGEAAHHVAPQVGMAPDRAVVGVQCDPRLVEQGANRRHVDSLAGPVHLDDVARYG